MISSYKDKPSLEFLEIMTIRACNLSCQGCTTFSDLQHSGYVTWNTGKSWLEPWTHKLNIQAVGLMGGEPLINPEISQWLQGIRQLLPQAQIRFVTNGLLLSRHWHIVDLLEKLGNCVLKISCHIQDERLDSVIHSIQTSRHWEPITEFGIARWISASGLRFQITKPTRFFKTFCGSYSDMKPHNNLPDKAFEMCVQKKCPLLYNGRIWKCGTLALTPDLLNRMGNPNIDLWTSYLQTGLTIDCKLQDLDKFVTNFGKPHAACRQCPTEKDLDSILDHSTTVVFK
jgi:sulfatase maturation enzyme AslB (radical SAM superfamily)